MEELSENDIKHLEELSENDMKHMKHLQELFNNDKKYLQELSKNDIKHLKAIPSLEVSLKLTYCTPCFIFSIMFSLTEKRKFSSLSLFVALIFSLTVVYAHKFHLLVSHTCT